MSSTPDEPQPVIGRYDAETIDEIDERIRVLHSLTDQRVGLDADQVMAVATMTFAERAALLAELVDAAHAEALDERH